MTGKAVIDRFEDDVAVLEVDGAERQVPRTQLPKDAKEGDVLDLATMTVDAEATRAQRQKVADARAALRKAKPKSL